MKKISKIRKIVLVPRLIHASWREFLKGFLDRARIHPNWSIRLLQSPDELTPEHVDDIIANGTDGIVVCESIPIESKMRLKSLDIPLVVIGMKDDDFESKTGGAVFIRNDDEDIGRFGARYMLSLGNFATWGFVPDQTAAYWSELRQKGFTEEAVFVGQKDGSVQIRIPFRGSGRFGEPFEMVEKPSEARRRHGRIRRQSQADSRSLHRSAHQGSAAGGDSRSGQRPSAVRLCVAVHHQHRPRPCQGRSDRGRYPRYTSQKPAQKHLKDNSLKRKKDIRTGIHRPHIAVRISRETGSRFYRPQLRKTHPRQRRHRPSRRLPFSRRPPFSGNKR